MRKTEIWASVEAFLAVGIWGVSFVATKSLLGELQPVSLVWARFAVGVAILGVTALALKRTRPVPAKDLGYLALAGFVGITLHQWLQSTGLVTSQAVTGGWIVATMPASIALLSWIFLRERFTVLRVAGFALALAGVMLVISRGDWASLQLGRFGAPGDWLMLLSSPNWAVFTVLSRRGLERYPALWMMFLVMLFGWLFFSGLLALGPGLSEFTRLSAGGWATLIYLGVFSSGAAYILWYDALQKLSAMRTAAYLYIEPLFTMAAAVLLLGEDVPWAVLAGGAIILLGVWMVNRPSASMPVPPET